MNRSTHLPTKCAPTTPVQSVYLSGRLLYYVARWIFELKFAMCEKPEIGEFTVVAM